MAESVYDNRELSWLKFNKRVLEEAQDTSVPLCERLAFASIYQSNLDEFFMVRVGSITDRMLVDANYRENKTGLTCQEQLDAIFDTVRKLEPIKDVTYSKIMSQLTKRNLTQVTFKTATEDEQAFLENYFKKEIRPVIFPLVISKRNPFPFLANKKIYAALHLETKSEQKQSTSLGIIPISSSFPRIVMLNDEKTRFILIEDIILHFAESVFKRYNVSAKTLFRITRNADITAQEATDDDDISFRDIMEELVKTRKKLLPVRLQLSSVFNNSSFEHLLKKLGLKENQVFYSKAPLDLSFAFELLGTTNNPKLKNSPLVPAFPYAVAKRRSMISQVKSKDILLSYPFETIQPFIKLLNEAATDKAVVSIKITLYRLAKNSQVINALCKAAENGKQVLVLIELRARFDEENNIEWSKRLEQAGCTVIYGPPDYKVHSKLLLITRKTDNDFEYISQIGTGNYNEKTAALYTDLCLMTANQEIGNDAAKVFDALCTESFVENAQQLLVAPLCLQNRILEMMDEQIAIAKEGKPAYIAAKVNSLSDKDIIDKIIEASQAGVKVELVIRGLCCIKAGVEGFTDNVSVISIVGRYLEHSRVYFFGTPDNQKIYISSADYMTRNTLCRVEVAAPILDERLKQRLRDMFKTLMNDNVKARVQMPNGDYIRKINTKKPLDSQVYFFEEAIKKEASKSRRQKSK